MEKGKITSGGGGLFLWELQDVRISFEDGFRDKSPRFTFFGVEYYIILWKQEQSDRIFSTLWRTDDLPFPPVSMEFQLRSVEERVFLSHTVKTDGRTKNVICGMYIDEFLSKKNDSVLFPRLTLSLRMKDGRTHHGEEEKVNEDSHESDSESDESDSESDEGEANSKYRNLKKLQKDLKKLFMSEKDADVTLKVQGKEYPAHKAILRSRSPVFDAMFGHDMEEKLSGAVSIEDCDNRTFPDFLNYLYTGSTEHVSEKNVCQLYAASDKYGVMELTAECREFTKSHFSVETFCDFIGLALKHQDGELIDSATKFFCVNVVRIVESEKWQTFLTKHPIAGNELFLKAWKSEKKM